MAEKIIQTEYLYRGRLIKLRLDQVRMPNNSMHTREIVEHSGAVAIVALDEQGRVLLERQYRSAAARETLEIPAGTLENGEDPSLCAVRELREETGYSAAEWEKLGAFYSSPGFSTEIMYLFLARGLKPGPSSPEEDESIAVEWRPLADALAAIENGEIADAKSMVGLLRVARKLSL